jgi:redox-sensitive bicupin YhaK (pirin superfamily)
VTPAGKRSSFGQRNLLAGPLGNLEAGTELDYAFKKSGNGVYVFLLEGDVTIDGQPLNKRDGFGVWDTETIGISANTDAKVLLMEVPMEL